MATTNKTAKAGTKAAPKIKPSNKLKEWAECTKKPSIQKVYVFGNEQEITVTIKGELSFLEHLSFENDAREMAMLKNFNDIEDYQPCLQEFAIQCAVVSYYTDLSLDTDTDSLWAILHNTALFNDIIEYAGQDVYESIECVRRIYDAHLRYVTTNSNYNKLLDKITSALDKINFDIDEDKLGDILGAFKNISGTSPEKIVETIINSANKKEETH